RRAGGDSRNGTAGTPFRSRRQSCAACSRASRGGGTPRENVTNTRRPAKGTQAARVPRTCRPRKKRLNRPARAESVLIERPENPVTPPPLAMPSLDEWRKALGREDLTDEEVEEFVQALRNLLGQFLDEYFREEFQPDEV